VLLGCGLPTTDRWSCAGLFRHHSTRAVRLEIGKDATVATVNRFIDTTPPQEKGLRGLLREGVDAMARALRARQRDATAAG